MGQRWHHYTINDDATLEECHKSRTICKGQRGKKERKKRGQHIFPIDRNLHSYNDHEKANQTIVYL